MAAKRPPKTWNITIIVTIHTYYEKYMLHSLCTMHITKSKTVQPSPMLTLKTLQQKQGADYISSRNWKAQVGIEQANTTAAVHGIMSDLPWNTAMQPSAQRHTRRPCNQDVRFISGAMSWGQHQQVHVRLSATLSHWTSVEMLQWRMSIVRYRRISCEWLWIRSGQLMASASLQSCCWCSSRAL